MDPLVSDAPLIVYLDFKSPYAFLALDPIRGLARELGIRVDWRPFVLDIPSYLGSARLDAGGRVAEERRTPEQWGSVKYAYFDCRRYANLRGLMVRGTTKIWDTSLAAIGLLWAREQGDAVVERYLDGVYEPFWRRELDVEDAAAIRCVLAEAGADVWGFEAWASGPGREANRALQDAAFDAGIFGVPTFVLDGEPWFGREHLPRLRWQLSGGAGPAPDVAYELPAALPPLARAERLSVCVDFKSPQCYLALAPTCALADELALDVEWLPLLAPPLRGPEAYGTGTDRGTRHRRLRAASLARDLERYAPHPLEGRRGDFDATAAALGLLWLNESAPGRSGRYVRAAFERYWKEGADLADRASIRALLDALGADAQEFERFAAGPGPDALAACRARLAERGAVGVPAYLLDGEPFVGRQHLPLVRARLRA